MKPSLLVLGTANPHKAAELAECLAPSGLRTITLEAFPHVVPAQETGETLQENASRKAAQLAVQLGLPVLADDTGLFVDALGGEPGVRSARYAGPAASAEANRRRLLAELDGVEPGRRTARFVCWLALADPSGTIVAESQGQVRGRIRTEPAGTGGFGYDVLFEIAEYGRTLAELGPALTRRIGHRGRAVEHLLLLLARLGTELGAMHVPCNRSPSSGTAR